jgi:hypothetical protein
MKRICLAVALVLVMGTAVACGSSDDSPKATPAASQPAAGTTLVPPASSSAATFTLAGFADHTAPGNFAPPDITATGGTLKSCNPQRLYAFVNFSGLAAPKQFVGSWTLNGAALNSQTFTQTANSATSFFEVQNTPQPLVAGAYRFQLVVDSNVVTQGSFTLAC